MSSFSRIEQTSLGSLATRANSGDELSQRIFSSLKKIDDSAASYAQFNFRPARERTSIFDEAVKDFLKGNPSATILNAGCGFCTRFFRLDNSTCTWIDLDFPTIIEVKRGLVPENARYQLVSHDLQKDFDIDYDLLVIEGSLVYLPEERAQQLIKGRVLFDVLSENRTTPLGSDQKWRYNPDNWDLSILREWEILHKFGKGPKGNDLMHAIRVFYVLQE